MSGLGRGSLREHARPDGFEQRRYGSVKHPFDARKFG